MTAFRKDSGSSPKSFFRKLMQHRGSLQFLVGSSSSPKLEVLPEYQSIDDTANDVFAGGDDVIAEGDDDITEEDIQDAKQAILWGQQQLVRLYNCMHNLI